MTLHHNLYSSPQGPIHYWMNDTDSPLTLVFLPGLTADHRLFEKQLEQFSRQYRVLVWDAPGHGESRPFDLNFSLMDKARWLHGILEQEKLKNPVLIGQSMGGYVSQCFLELYPREAAGFVAIDSAPLQRKYVTSWEIALLKDCQWMFDIIPWKLLIRWGSRGCATSTYGRQLMREMMLSYEKRDYCRLSGHGFRILAEAMEAELPYEIPCPALLICGEKDAAGSARSYNKRWHKESGLPLHWIKGAGHNSNTDRPEEINGLLADFLSSLPCNQAQNQL